MKKFFKYRALHSYRTIEDAFFLLGTVFAVAAAAAFLLSPLLHVRINLPPCWFHMITGYYCPGCGGTRAFYALCHGQILRAAWYHPFVPYAAAVYLYFMATQAVERISRGNIPVGMRYHNYLVWTAVALIIGNCILKNILHYFYGFIL